MTRSQDLSRRAFLQSLGAGGLALGSGALLAGCGRGSSGTNQTPATASASAVSTPRRGGTLRVGMLGAGESESFNPENSASAYINLARISAVYDPLIIIGPDLGLQPALATKWATTPAADEWTFTLRSGVTWHDGTPLTVDDVIYSIRWAAKGILQTSVADVDLGKMHGSGNSVVIPLTAPDLLFPQNVSQIAIIPKGATSFTKPIGTGPFIFQSLTPGQQSVCTRNPNYWNAPKPYVDKLIIQSIDDDSARLNALLGGQIDLMSSLPFVQAKAQRNSSQITLLNTPSIAAQSFYMDVTQAPFDDVRVRQAIRLVADRQQLVDVALSGFGAVANDLFGAGLPFYDTSLPQRTQDLAQAKSLLAAAGHGSGLSLTLQTSTVSPGMVEAATLFAQQAQGGGVDIKIVQVDPTAYFDPSLKYLKMAFAQTIWAGFSTLPSFYQYAMLPGAAGNETHWSNKQTTQLIHRASVATDQASAAASWNQLQRQQYDEGGYLWWANVNNVDACSTKLAGVTPSKYLAMGLPNSLTDAYFTS